MTTTDKEIPIEEIYEEIEKAVFVFTEAVQDRLWEIIEIMINSGILEALEESNKELKKQKDN